MKKMKKCFHIFPFLLSKKSSEWRLVSFQVEVNIFLSSGNELSSCVCSVLGSDLFAGRSGMRAALALSLNMQEKSGPSS